MLGIDIAKNTFQLHGADVSGKAVHKKRLTRRELAAHVANLPACTIVMEACGGANYWARVFQGSGHSVKLISPQFVKPFVKTNKNDAKDAQAIVEAASRPSMHFVPIKQVEQQDIQFIHRIRTRIVKNRTALINEIRGLCLEYGVVLIPGAARVKSSLCAAIADSDNELTPSSRESLQGLYEGLVDVEARLKNLDNDYNRWVGRKKATLSHNKAAVALANKNARIIWSMLNTGEEFNIGAQATAA
jgi:transposase